MNKKQIIKLFYKNVRGKIPNITNRYINGNEGHWLEKQMGIDLNNNSCADIGGYEMKKMSDKITFGDWNATEYLFSKNTKFINSYNNENIQLTRNKFIHTFGTYKENKERYSWSGTCVPIYNKWNLCGQIILIDKLNNILVMYSHNRDTREYKHIFPQKIKSNQILVAYWCIDKINEHVNKKFNQNGFFICKKDMLGRYSNICFGDRFTPNDFIENIKNNNIILDSGMYIGNNRNYSNWRASKKFWNDLIIEEY
jgi:hypothetical protein